MALINFRKPSTWPPGVLNALHTDEEVFADWVLDRPARSAAKFDAAFERLERALAGHEVIGYHCTRLTEREMAAIRSGGMQLPNADVLASRIGARVDDGDLDADTAKRLLARHQANDANRRGRLWFCTYPPSRAGRGGIGRFFRHWGGESLYNSHEDDPLTSPWLSAIGVPCVVEVRLPVSALKLGSAPMHLVNRYLASRGYKAVELNDSDVQLLGPLEPARILDIHQCPGTAFERLVGFSP